jgi:hypothetical protein
MSRHGAHNGRMALDARYVPLIEAVACVVPMRRHKTVSADQRTQPLRVEPEGSRQFRCRDRLPRHETDCSADGALPEPWPPKAEPGGRVSAMRQVFGGAALIIAAFALAAAAQRNQPIGSSFIPGQAGSYSPAHGLSRTAYDVVRIGALALLLVGVLLIVMGMIQYWAQNRR